MDPIGKPIVLKLCVLFKIDSRISTHLHGQHIRIKGDLTLYTNKGSILDQNLSRLIQVFLFSRLQTWPLFFLGLNIPVVARTQLSKFIKNFP